MYKYTQNKVDGKYKNVPLKDRTDYQNFKISEVTKTFVEDIFSNELRKIKIVYFSSKNL